MAASNPVAQLRVSDEAAWVAFSVASRSYIRPRQNHRWQRHTLAMLLSEAEAGRTAAHRSNRHVHDIEHRVRPRRQRRKQVSTPGLKDVKPSCPHVGSRPPSLQGDIENRT
jgi:hypothetical protein